MAARFLHAADIHLGFMQYNCKERFNDFAHAFLAVIDDAIARRVDFVALAGDLFNKRAIDPPTLLQATAALERLKAAGIPAIAIEGNHERSYYNEGFTWLDYLAEVNLLTLLTPAYAQGRMTLAPWDGRAHTGAYIDLPCGVRVIGARYAGASTARLVQDLAGALAALPGPRPAYTVLMLHAGVQGVLDQYSGTLSRAQLEQLRPYVDYLALGHIHKPFIQDDWIYNPGSLETNSTGEVDWDDRGYFVVEVEPGRVPAHRVTKVRGRRREFVRLRFEVDAWPDPEALCAQVQAYLSREFAGRPAGAAEKPVVELQLVGILPFNHGDLDVKRIEGLVNECYSPLLCNVRDNTTPNDFEIGAGENLSRAELEQYVLRELLERDVRRRERSGEWANLVLRLKGLALGGGSPGDITAELRAFRDGADTGSAAGEEAAPC